MAAVREGSWTEGFESPSKCKSLLARRCLSTDVFSVSVGMGLCFSERGSPKKAFFELVPPSHRLEVQKGRARAGAGRVMFVRLGLLWLAALALSLACCFFLGSLHRPGAPPRPFTQRALLRSDLSRYGSHSQLQIAAALFCSLVLATWAAAEAPRLNASIAKCSYRRRRRPRSTQSEDFRHPPTFCRIQLHKGTCHGSRRWRSAGQTQPSWVCA